MGYFVITQNESWSDRKKAVRERREFLVVRKARIQKLYTVCAHRMTMNDGRRLRNPEWLKPSSDIEMSAPDSFGVNADPPEDYTLTRSIREITKAEAVAIMLNARRIR